MDCNCVRVCFLSMFCTGLQHSTSVDKSAADSLLPIVQSQRERYRVRAQELEAVCTLLYALVVHWILSKYNVHLTISTSLKYVKNIETLNSKLAEIQQKYVKTIETLNSKLTEIKQKGCLL